MISPARQAGFEFQNQGRAGVFGWMQNTELSRIPSCVRENFMNQGFEALYQKVVHCREVLFKARHLHCSKSSNSTTPAHRLKRTMV